MNNETEKYKNYKAYLTIFIITLSILFITTDNFLYRFLKSRTENIVIKYGLAATNISIISNKPYKNINKIKQIVPQDQSIFSIDLKEIYNNIIRVPEIKTATIHRKLFNTIKIKLEIYEPIAQLKENNLLLCKDGSIIKNNTTTQLLPIITGINHKKKFLNFYKRITKYDIDITNNIKSIIFNSQNIELIFKNKKIAKLKYKFNKNNLLKILTQ